MVDESTDPANPTVKIRAYYAKNMHPDDQNKRFLSKSDVKHFIMEFYNALAVSNNRSNLQVDRSYWEAYINQLAAGKEKPYPKASYVNLASNKYPNVLPSVTDGVPAQMTASLMKFIIDTINKRGFFKHTSEQLLDIVSSQSMSSLPHQEVPTPPQQIKQRPQGPNKTIFEQREDAISQEIREAKLQQQRMKGPLPTRG
jgi:hypothetical protein